MVPNLLFALLNLLIFLNGFMPLRSTNQSSKGTSEIIKPPILSDSHFDQMILMVVDALRLDFVNKAYMPLTTSLIENNGCLMNVKVSSPTVTLPRIKSLTTGNVPQFVDVFYNLGNPQYLEDSILHSAKNQNYTIVFYGDDTWIKVFPEIFTRKDGTTSFYVTDFYEVDNNVTNNANYELEHGDWDLMILHYLGLDHIGHVHGPFSPLVPPKLDEMDKMVHHLFTELSKKNTKSLFILTGDHGMKDSGGHGGSTYAEMHVPLVLLGTTCENESIDQIDIAANLAVLLNLEIPSASIGILNRQFLNKLSQSQYTAALDYNLKILKSKVKMCENESQIALELYKSYLETQNINKLRRAQTIYEKCSKDISRKLARESESQNIDSMVVSVIFLCVTLTIALDNFQLPKQLNQKYLFYCLITAVRVCLPVYFSSFVGVLFLAMQLPVVFKLFKNTFQLNRDILVIVAVIFVQPLTWLASSFIEEEQEYWYYILNTFIILHVIKHTTNQNFLIFFYWCSVSTLIRFGETLNQTGDKWASRPDTSDFLIKPENYPIHIIILSTSISYVYFNRFKEFKFKFFDTFIFLIIFIHKLDILNQVILTRLAYLLIFINLFIARNGINCWVFLICLVAKSYNVCLISMCIYFSHVMVIEYGEGLFSILTHVTLAKILFFMQGNGNSLANIDVTVGYLGLYSFQPLWVGLQVLLNIYSYVVLIHLILIQSFNDIKQIFHILYVERLYSMVVTCFIVLIFKNHISVWTIYAPKLFIEFCHTLIFFIEVAIYVVVLNLPSICQKFKQWKQK